MDSYYLFGGEKAVFKNEEMAEVKSLGEPGLRLIGFKPREAIDRKLYYTTKHSSFIFPDEEVWYCTAYYFSYYIWFRASLEARAYSFSFCLASMHSTKLLFAHLFLAEMLVLVLLPCYPK